MLPSSALAKTLLQRGDYPTASLDAIGCDQQIGNHVGGAGKMWRELLRPPTGSHPKTKGWGGAAASKDGTEGSVTRTEANGDGDVVK